MGPVGCNLLSQLSSSQLEKQQCQHDVDLHDYSAVENPETNTRRYLTGC